MTCITIGLIDENVLASNENLSACFTNSTAWEAFGDFLDKALSENDFLLNEVKGEQWVYGKTYSFQDLSKNNFNFLIYKIREYIKVNDDMNFTSWDNWGISVWNELVEKLIINDCRYDKMDIN